MGVGQAQEGEQRRSAHLCHREASFVPDVQRWGWMGPDADAKLLWRRGGLVLKAHMRFNNFGHESQNHKGRKIAKKNLLVRIVE